MKGLGYKTVKRVNSKDQDLKSGLCLSGQVQGSFTFPSSLLCSALASHPVVPDFATIRKCLAPENSVSPELADFHLVLGSS